MSKDVEGRLIQQAIYEEIEKSPVDEKRRKYLREKPYHLRKGKNEKNFEISGK